MLVRTKTSKFSEEGVNLNFPGLTLGVIRPSDIWFFKKPHFFDSQIKTVWDCNWVFITTRCLMFCVLYFVNIWRTNGFCRTFNIFLQKPKKEFNHYRASIGIVFIKSVQLLRQVARGRFLFSNAVSNFDCFLEVFQVYVVTCFFLK